MSGLFLYFCSICTLLLALKIIHHIPKVSKSKEKLCLCNSIFHIIKYPRFMPLLYLKYQPLRWIPMYVKRKAFHLMFLYGWIVLLFSYIYIHSKFHLLPIHFWVSDNRIMFSFFIIQLSVCRHKWSLHNITTTINKRSVTSLLSFYWIIFWLIN